MNPDRADRALESLVAYNNEDIKADITDLLTDLQHLCEIEQISFSDCCAMALIHYREESKR